MRCPYREALASASCSFFLTAASRCSLSRRRRSMLDRWRFDFSAAPRASPGMHERSQHYRQCFMSKFVIPAAMHGYRTNRGGELYAAPLGHVHVGIEDKLQYSLPSLNI
jgi:hypothetical protein